MCPTLESVSELGGCLIDWKRLSTWKASQKFCSLVVSWSRGVYCMPQNLEHAQQWMPHNYVKFQRDPSSGAVAI